MYIDLLQQQHSVYLATLTELMVPREQVGSDGAVDTVLKRTARTHVQGTDVSSATLQSTFPRNKGFATGHTVSSFLLRQMKIECFLLL